MRIRASSGSFWFCRGLKVLWKSCVQEVDFASSELAGNMKTVNDQAILVKEALIKQKTDPEST